MEHDKFFVGYILDVLFLGGCAGVFLTNVRKEANMYACVRYAVHVYDMLCMLLLYHVIGSPGRIKLAQRSPNRSKSTLYDHATGGGTTLSGTMPALPAGSLDQQNKKKKKKRNRASSWEAFLSENILY